MAYTSLTQNMIEREACLIANRFGLIPNLDQKALIPLFEKDTMGAELIYFSVVANNKTYKVSYANEDTSMSLDDFSERIIYPFILSLLINDLKLIHLDCT